MSENIDVEDFPYGSLVVSLERFTWHNTRVVNENGDRSYFALNLLPEVSHVFQCRYIASNEIITLKNYTRLGTILRKIRKKKKNCV